MSPWRRRTACDRASLWISLELDGELSELERAALAAHLDGCVECSSAHAEIAGFTTLLRDAPLEGPALAGAALALLPPPRARRVRRTAALTLAAAIATSAAVLVVSKPTAPEPATGLASATLAQRLKYANAEHARIDPRLPTAALLRPVQLAIPAQLRSEGF